MFAPRMQFAIVQNDSSVIVPVQQEETVEVQSKHYVGESCKVLLDVNLLPYNNKAELKEDARNYCQKLCDVIRKDESNKGIWQVCAHFKWNHVGDLKIKLHGRALQELNELCGEGIQLVFQGTLSRRKEGSSRKPVKQHFTTSDMWIQSYSGIKEVGDERGCWEFNHAIEAYCENLVKFRSIHKWYDGQADFVKVTAEIIRFRVRDHYINLSDGVKSPMDKIKLNVLKTIMSQDSSTDVTIVVDSGAKLTAHKCFLIAHSRVLAEMLQQSTFGRLKLKDVSEKCAKALLEYVYTFEISQAVKCSEVAVQLFEAATQYEIHPLQEKIVKMLLQRNYGWYDVNKTLELFLFIRKLGKTSTIDQLKAKIGQVLKLKGKRVIMASDGYHKLVTDDVRAASELCSTMAIAD